MSVGPSSQPDGHAAAGHAHVEAAVVSPSGAGAAYAMYRVQGGRTVEPGGGDVVVLAGGLLLERGEEVVVELRFPDRATTRARARVLDILPGEAAMRVVLSGLDDADRQRLARYATA